VFASVDSPARKGRVGPGAAPGTSPLRAGLFSKSATFFLKSPLVVRGQGSMVALPKSMHRSRLVFAGASIRLVRGSDSILAAARNVRRSKRDGGPGTCGLSRSRAVLGYTSARMRPTAFGACLHCRLRGRSGRKRALHPEPAPLQWPARIGRRDHHPVTSPAEGPRTKPLRQRSSRVAHPWRSPGKVRLVPRGFSLAVRVLFCREEL
jgi:hypothetical protein